MITRTWACWLRQLDGVGQAHFFHRQEYCEPEPDLHSPDDLDTLAIRWPNYHSGRNGDVQRLEVVEPLHPLLRRDDLPRGRVELFPSHPHQAAVRAPTDEPRARAIARGHSQTTGHPFNLVVAFERTAAAPARAIAESSFHHFADYNWDIDHGAPSFVSEPPGDGIRRDPHALDHVRAYVQNAVAWLAPEGRRRRVRKRSSPASPTADGLRTGTSLDAGAPARAQTDHVEAKALSKTSTVAEVRATSSMPSSPRRRRTTRSRPRPRRASTIWTPLPCLGAARRQRGWHAR